MRALLALIPNSIGEVAFSDISTETPLYFEGVAPTIGNVTNGSYPLWYYEQWFTNNAPNPTLSANQYTLISTLLTAYTNASYQASNPNFVGNYVPLANLPVQRSSDGAVIQSSIY